MLRDAPQTCAMIESRILAQLRESGYERLPEEPMVSSRFADTFVPSACHDPIVAAVTRGPCTGASERLCGSSYVFRHIDTAAASAGTHHLTVFRMLVFFVNAPALSAGPELCAEVTREFMGALRVVGIEPSTLRVLVPRLPTRLREAPDAEWLSDDMWLSSGLERRQVVRVHGDIREASDVRSGEPAGVRCEVFAKAGGNRWIEIGTLAFERWLNDLNLSSPCSLGAGTAFGGAIGIERAAMCCSRRDSIFDLPELRGGVLSLSNRTGSDVAELCRSDVQAAIDALRALAIVLDRTTATAVARRGKRLERLGRIAQRALCSLGIERRCHRDIVRELVPYLVGDSVGKTQSDRVLEDIQRFVMRD